MRVVVLCAVALLSLVVACGAEEDDFVDTAEVEASEEEQALLSGGYGRPTKDDVECKDTNAGTLRCDEDDAVVTPIRR